MSTPLRSLVACKRVEDPESKIRVAPSGDRIVTEDVSYRLNPFDEIAIEEALRLRERHGGEVVLVSIGGDRSVAELRAGLAMGADRAILVRHEGALDPVLAAALLAGVYQRERPDLVLLGKQSIDGDQGQTGQYLAARLGLGQVTAASKEASLESAEEQRREPGLVRSADGRRLTVQRQVDGGVEVLELALPGVVTVDLVLNKPRFAPLPAIMKAKRARVEELPASELAGDLSPKVIVRRLAEAPRRAGGVRVADVDELWSRLRDEAKVV